MKNAKQVLRRIFGWRIYLYDKLTRTTIYWKMHKKKPLLKLVCRGPYISTEIFTYKGYSKPSKEKYIMFVSDMLQDIGETITIHIDGSSFFCANTTYSNDGIDYKNAIRYEGLSRQKQRVVYDVVTSIALTSGAMHKDLFDFVTTLIVNTALAIKHTKEQVELAREELRLEVLHDTPIILSALPSPSKQSSPDYTSDYAV